MTTVREAVHRLMRELEMTTVFGNPGSTELRLFRDWPADFDYVLALQESSAVAMADGYAQATGRAALVNLHSAAGVGHGLGSIFTAHKNGTPLVVTAGQQTRAMLASEPYLFATDAAAFPRPYVKWALEPARAEDVPAAIARAHWEAMARPRGPVFVSVPEDDWDAECDPVAPRVVRDAFAGDVIEVAAALEGASSPALVVGPAVDRDGAWCLAVALAERTGATVWVSPVSSRCSFPEDHERFAGFLPPTAAGIAAQLAPHDVVVVLGAPVFTHHVHTDAPPLEAQLFHLTDDPSAAARAPVGTAIITTMAPALDALLRQVSARDRAVSMRDDMPSPGEQDPIRAERVMAAVRRLMPEDAVVVEEAPTHRNAMHDHLPITRPRSFFVAASGGLGWAVPASVGIALADPARLVVCLVGEGSSMYSIQALWTAAQRGARVAFVVLDNAAYVAMRALGGAIGIPDPPGIDLPALDVAAVAAGLGVPARRVEAVADLDQALTHAFAAAGPTLTNVVVDPALDPLY